MPCNRPCASLLRSVTVPQKRKTSCRSAAEPESFRWIGRWRHLLNLGQPAIEIWRRIVLVGHQSKPIAPLLVPRQRCERTEGIEIEDRQVV
jgi:hypothetical protein